MGDDEESMKDEEARCPCFMWYLSPLGFLYRLLQPGTLHRCGRSTAGGGLKVADVDDGLRCGLDSDVCGVLVLAASFSWPCMEWYLRPLGFLYVLLHPGIGQTYGLGLSLRVSEGRDRLEETPPLR